MMVTVTAVGGYTFHLLNTLMKQYGDTFVGPYQLRRKDLAKFYRGEITQIPYDFVGEREFNLHASVTKRAKTIRIGCMRFSPINTAKLRKWALASPAKKRGKR